ncbi:hypothetical protein GE21DRAFT_1281410 [Neurospora crassa]|nr:hypothetical protein GE21DRAFT_1281410 [Neurospora crassa]
MQVISLDPPSLSPLHKQIYRVIRGLKRAQCTAWYVCKEVGPKVPSFGHLDLAAGALWSWGSQQRGMASR